jgi:hypothetical protein
MHFQSKSRVPAVSTLVALSLLCAFIAAVPSQAGAEAEANLHRARLFGRMIGHCALSMGTTIVAMPVEALAAVSGKIGDDLRVLDGCRTARRQLLAFEDEMLSRGYLLKPTGRFQVMAPAVATNQAKSLPSASVSRNGQALDLRNAVPTAEGFHLIRFQESLKAQ